MNAKTRYLTTGMALLLMGLSLAIAVTLTAPQPASANPGVLYAAPNGATSGNCNSWANACTLQYALSRAVSGDEIWVKMGVHYPGAAGNRTATFTLKNGVALYGGFAGTESNRNERNWQINKTILSGDIDQNDNHGGDYINENASQIVGSNAYHVVTGGGTDSTAVLDGFIITAGQANGLAWPHWGGGGMYNYSSSPTLTNLTFSGNSADDSGGGMYNSNYSSPTLTNITFSGNSAAVGVGGGMYNSYYSNPTLTNVTFSDNSAEDGGGLYNWASNPTLMDVTFSGNSASYDHYGYGGGMFNSEGSPTLTNVTFTGNSATNGGGMFNNSSPMLTNITFSDNSADSGGGMYNYGNPTLTDVTFSDNSADSGGGMYNEWGSPTLTNVTFSGNSANWGGGMCNWNSSPTLINVTFSGNSADDSGGGMYNGGGSPTLTNVTFTGNSATDGGGMYNDVGGPTLTNVTFSGNSANSSGGGMYNYYSSPTLTNVIIWGNTATTNGPNIYNTARAATISYSDIQGCGSSGVGWNLACGTDGGGNVDADPRFVDAANGNLRLQDGSPSIDTGNNAAVPPGVTTDLDGNPRFDYTVDMGAYEYQAGPGPRPFGKRTPLNGDTSQPLPLTLSWNASPFANNYAYCYRCYCLSSERSGQKPTGGQAQAAGARQGPLPKRFLAKANREAEALPDRPVAPPGSGKLSPRPFLEKALRGQEPRVYSCTFIPIIPCPPCAGASGWCAFPTG